jgi:TonB family protein
MSDGLQLLLPDKRSQLRVLFGGATTTHLGLFLVFVLVSWLGSDRPVSPVGPFANPPNIVWIADHNPGGGGGGGGNKRPEPSATSEVAAVKPPERTPVAAADPVPEPDPIAAAEVPAVPIAARPALVAMATESPSAGPGRDTGAGSGSRDGIGADDGKGLGPGDDKGTGDRVYATGNGVSDPTLLYRPKPRYTSDAMQRRVQGEVQLDCVALVTGLLSRCEIVKSLDSNSSGLDDEALRAATEFRFKPAMKSGEPVPVRVRIVLEFNMR